MLLANEGHLALVGQSPPLLGNSLAGVGKLSLKSHRPRHQHREHFFGRRLLGRVVDYVEAVAVHAAYFPKNLLSKA
jgi:hypothetical protein